MNTTSKSSSLVGQSLSLTMIPIGIGINIGIGALIHLLKLPVYLDAIGTILVTILLGWRAGVITGVVGFIITSLIINPLAVYFSGTQAAISIFVFLMGKKGWFSNTPKVIATGIGLGIVSAVISAPVIVYFFGGVTGNGASLIVAYLATTGKTIINSVLLSGFSIEPIDKTVQCLLAFYLLKSIPKNLISKFSGGCLKENNFI